MNIVRSTFDYSKIQVEQYDQSNVIQYSSIRQIISRARMEKKPVLIVEGRDDISVYEKLSKNADKVVSIRAIETITGYGEGCENVVKFIDEAQDVIKESETNKNFLLGIIDRDASYFRGQDYSSLECLFVLKAYSYESHFISRNHTIHLLENLVHSTQYLNSRIIEYVEKDLELQFSELYYLSLEALKNACCKGYSGDIGFKLSYGQIKNQKVELLEKVLAKKDELDKFAIERQISKEDLKQIVKGKWLIELYIENVFEKIKELETLCSDPGVNIINCIYCVAGINSKCEWKLKKSATKEFARLMVYQYNDPSETKYIVDRIRMLA